MPIRPTQIALGLTAIPIIVAAAYCLSWTEVSVKKLTATDDGMVVGFVRKENANQYSHEARQWSADLSQVRVIDLGEKFVSDIDVATSGDVLVVVYNNGIRLLDIKTGEILWTVKGDRDGRFVRPLKLVCNAEYLVVGKYDGDANVVHMRIYRAADHVSIGKLDERQVLTIRDIQSGGKRFAYRTWNRELAVVDLTGDEVREIVRIPGVDAYHLRDDGSIVLRVGQKIQILDAAGVLAAAPSGAFAARFGAESTTPPMARIA